MPIHLSPLRDLIRQRRRFHADDQYVQEPTRMGSWLCIPFDKNDLGARMIPTGVVFWESPNIWIEGGDEFGNAVAGRPTRIFARITNCAWIPCFPTRISFAFFDPSLGIPWNAPRLIGTTYTLVPSWILGSGSRVVECPVAWIPPNGTTHCCLLVMCSCATTNDEPVQPWLPVYDRHVAQHNVGVVAAKPGTTLSYSLQTAVLSPSTAKVTLAVHASFTDAPSAREAMASSRLGFASTLRDLDETEDEVQRRMLARRVALEYPHVANTRAVALDPEEARRIVQVEKHRESRHWRQGAVVSPQRHPRDAFSEFTPVHEVEEARSLESSTVQLTLRVPEETRGRRYFLLRVAQFENGFVTGGYTFIVDTQAKAASVHRR
ncbi:MAG: hypothetical protein QM784_37925 [Polyangiaceae bacterium]